ncbi:hypothetical protein [Hymenobacter properus]|uniref:Uncharacterized protein n=1 Tax=Hymenobacter properus TaxID=2791026 RepID=A0A931BJB9_9BACT|nr:hypothetical protein [Hymenobacter properus]MBF9141273.1 hypothetical protein [Hymenobacter properus]MBR7720083.1 hypothetical protein [Microvirga sp. SRT04]
MPRKETSKLLRPTVRGCHVKLRQALYFYTPFTMYHKYFFLAAVGFISVSCSKKSDAGPSIPANTIQLSDNGQAVTFASSTATAVLETNAQGQKQMTIQAATSDNNHQIALSFADRQGVETPRTYGGDPTSARSAGSAYTVSLTNYSTRCRSTTFGTQLYQFYSGTTSPVDFKLVIQAVDVANHTVSGTFQGTYTLGCDSRNITNGQFNLPYTVKP